MWDSGPCALCHWFIVIVDGEELGFWITTLGSKSWGWSLLGQSIGRSIERCRVRVGGGVVTCGFFATGSVSLDHRWMAW